MQREIVRANETRRRKIQTGGVVGREVNVFIVK
jgi:hypothetical protein